MQLDIFGELMDSVYLFNKYGSLISYDCKYARNNHLLASNASFKLTNLFLVWCHLVRILNWLVDNWKQEDEGLWEVRSKRQHFVYSKVFFLSSNLSCLCIFSYRLCVGWLLIGAFG